MEHVTNLPPLYCTARIPDRAKTFEALEADGVCVFCSSAFVRRVTQLRRAGTHWNIVVPPRPYPGSAAHLIAAYNGHITTTGERQPGAMEEYFDLFEWFMAEYQLVGAANFMRVGKMEVTCSSVSHLHGHFVAGLQDVDAEHLDKYLESILHYGYHLPAPAGG